jgi:Cap4 dsDNA endonuclease
VPKDLLDELVEKPQRETAGPDTSSRFDYQKNWAFCQMLRRHMVDADYIVAFEFHDDVVFLSPSAAPTTAQFFQVKTSKSATARKLADLISRQKTANSILGKMFLNFAGVCSNHAVQIILVSNIAFEFSDKDLSANDLAPKYREKIVAKLKAEIPAFSEAQFDCLHFMITGVSLDAMQSFLHGEVLELFKTRFGEDHGLNVHSWIRFIQSEIVRKNNYPSETVTTVADLVSKKCLSKKAVDDSLSLISSQRKTTPDMMIVNGELKSAGWSIQDIMRTSKKMPQAAADYTDSINLEAAKLVLRLEALFEGESAWTDLPSFIDAVEQNELPGLPTPYNDRHYLAALSVVVYYEKI